MARKPANPATPAPAIAPATTNPATTPATTNPALPWVGMQHGVQPPKRAGLCSAVWELTSAGAVQGAAGTPPTLPPLATVKAAALAQGLNATNVSIEYYRCRAWYGVRGRQAAPAAQ